MRLFISGEKANKRTDRLTFAQTTKSGTSCRDGSASAPLHINNAENGREHRSSPNLFVRFGLVSFVGLFSEMHSFSVRYEPSSAPFDVSVKYSHIL